MVVRSLGLDKDKALVVGEEVKPLVAGAELHKAQSEQKHSLDLVEMDQTHLVVAQLAQRMELRSGGNMSHLEPAMLHNYGRYDTDYS
jgi:hypothetical protein